MGNNLLLPFIMRESGATVNDTPNIHCTGPTLKDHYITFSNSELKIHLHINVTFFFFHIRRPTDDELQSYEKIFITPNLQHCNTYWTLYDLN